MIPEGWVCLREVGMDYEADIIVGLLEDNNISAVKHYPEAGEYLKLAYGMASGVRIYVPKEDYEQGKALLAESLLSEPEDTGQADLEPIEAEGPLEDAGLIENEALPGLHLKTTGHFGLLAFVLLLAFVVWAFWQGSTFFTR
ncbi:MAG: DUF2007 domain-containing protein [Desulfitobacteriaceae bacterium]|nr:DUF2007 domain-containing protein [Desulfitobacteriaceae bacterium]MDI6878547.1 DUF2007 domain-containing protein [Desulfitobacteriaceae bacterium]MDI6913982.1 DUF2007 domain-containing protein [Desulfitobacteriaceae bacterium]